MLLRLLNCTKKVLLKVLILKFQTYQSGKSHSEKNSSPRKKIIKEDKSFLQT